MNAVKVCNVGDDLEKARGTLYRAFEIINRAASDARDHSDDLRDMAENADDPVLKKADAASGLEDALRRIADAVLDARYDIACLINAF